MRNLIIMLLLALSFSVVYGEDDTLSSSSTVSHKGSSALAFSKGDNVFGVGVGINVNYNSYSGSIIDTTDITPGVGLLWDHGSFNNMFSMGAGLDGAFYRDYSYLSPSFRFGFHPFGLPPLDGKLHTALTSVLDPYVVAYAGLSIGLGVESYDPVDVLYPWWGASLGVRWMFKSAVGLMAEGDWNHALIGFVFKF